MRRTTALVLLLPLLAGITAAHAQLLLIPAAHPLDASCTQYSTTQGFFRCISCHSWAITCTSCHYYQLGNGFGGANVSLAWKACWDCHVYRNSVLYQLCTQGRGGVPPPTINLTNVHDVHHILLNVTNVTDIQWDSYIVYTLGYPPRPVSCACHAIYHAHPHRFEYITPYGWDGTTPIYVWGVLFLLPTASLNNGSKPNATIPSTAPGTGSFKVYFFPVNTYLSLSYDPILSSYYGGPYGVFVGVTGFADGQPLFLAFTNRSAFTVNPRGYYRDLYPLQLSNATLRASEQAVTWVIPYTTQRWQVVLGNNSASAIAYNRLTAYACMTCHFNATRAGVSLLGEPAGRRVELPAVELALPAEAATLRGGASSSSSSSAVGLLVVSVLLLSVVVAAVALLYRLERGA